MLTLSRWFALFTLPLHFKADIPALTAIFLQRHDLDRFGEGVEPFFRRCQLPYKPVVADRHRLNRRRILDEDWPPLPKQVVADLYVGDRTTFTGNHYTAARVADEFRMPDAHGGDLLSLIRLNSASAYADECP
jgi:hypothetical protein